MYDGETDTQIGFLCGVRSCAVLVLVIAPVVIGLAWKPVVIGAVVLGGRWLLGAISVGPPGLGRPIRGDRDPAVDVLTTSFPVGCEGSKYTGPTAFSWRLPSC